MKGFSGIVLYGSDDSDFPIPILHYEQCIKLYDENGQYSCIQLKPLQIQLEPIDYSCKTLEEVFTKYHQPSVNGFRKAALVFMHIEMSEEFQD